MELFTLVESVLAVIGWLLVVILQSENRKLRTQINALTGGAEEGQRYGA